MISGPTTALSVLVFSALSTRYAPGSAEYIEAAITLTMLTGLFQLAFAFMRLGSITRFVSPSVMTGFTAGAAIIIALSQIEEALGISLPSTSDLPYFFAELRTQLPGYNLYGLALFTVTFASAALIRHFRPHWPNYLIALLASSLLAQLIGAQDHGVAFIASLSSVVPPIALPNLSVESVRELAQAALAIALVGLLEAVAIGRAIAARSGQTIDVNQEFFGQGLANLIGSIFSAYASSGSFTRSGVNYDAGARTPMAAILSSLILLFLLLFAADFVVYIPRPAIAGLIFLVALRLFHIDELWRIITTSRTESAIIAVTFLSTLAIGLEFAIYAGVLVSLALFLRQSAQPYIAKLAPDPASTLHTFKNAIAYKLDECPQLAIARIDGQIYFGSTETLAKQLKEIELTFPSQKHLLLILKGVDHIDFTGAELLRQETKRRRESGGELYLSVRQHQISLPLRDYGITELIGEENIFRSKDLAIEAIVEKLSAEQCRVCKKRVFRECSARPGGTREGSKQE
jgi:SulP family sulfate permease